LIIPDKNSTESSSQDQKLVGDFSDVAVVTVATRNYFHRVRSLFASVEEFMPGALRLACSMDAVEGFLNAEEEGYELVEANPLITP